MKKRIEAPWPLRFDAHQRGAPFGGNNWIEFIFLGSQLPQVSSSEWQLRKAATK